MSNISSGRVHPTTFPFPIRPKDLSCWFRDLIFSCSRGLLWLHVWDRGPSYI
jgi:hypothetical protein